MNTNDLDDTRTEIDATAELVREAVAGSAQPQKLSEDGRPYIINPHTGTPVDLSHLLANPLRIEAKPLFLELESFSAYVTAYKREGAALFANEKNVTAVLDYHAPPDAASQCTHHARLEFRETEGLKRWRAANGKALAQLQFVEFLEERAREIMTPQPASVLEICEDLHVVSGASVRSVARSGADTRLEFTKEEVAKGKSGEVDIPTKLQLYVQAFEGMPSFLDLLARLRVRIRDGAVTFTIQIEDLDLKVREAARSVAQNAASATALPLFI